MPSAGGSFIQELFLGLVGALGDPLLALFAVVLLGMGVTCLLSVLSILLGALLACLGSVLGAGVGWGKDAGSRPTV
jgi:hypothetical protein